MPDAVWGFFFSLSIFYKDSKPQNKVCHVNFFFPLHPFPSVPFSESHFCVNSCSVKMMTSAFLRAPVGKMNHCYKTDVLNLFRFRTLVYHFFQLSGTWIENNYCAASAYISGSLPGSCHCHGQAELPHMCSTWSNPTCPSWKGTCGTAPPVLHISFQEKHWEGQTWKGCSRMLALEISDRPKAGRGTWFGSCSGSVWGMLDNFIWLQQLSQWHLCFGIPERLLQCSTWEPLLWKKGASEKI